MNNELKLGKRQKQILDFIKQSCKEKGYPPSVREIGQAVGLKSSSTVHSHLVRLEEKGLIRRDPAKPRAIIPLDDEPLLQSEALSVPVIGNVAAGSPILAEQNIDNYLSIPVDFMGSGNHFILKVKGDSMIEAGILDGDYLIVREQADASNGEIVVALLDNEATVKRFYRRDDYVELKPENTLMDSIIVKDIQIAGKVAGLLRRI